VTTLLLSTDAVGGVWRYSLELARGIAAAGIKVVLAVLGPDPDPAQRREATGIPGLVLCATGLPLDWTAPDPTALANAACALARLAWRVQADTVHLHSPALMGSAIWPVPVVAVAHSCVATWWQAVQAGPLPADLAWRARATAAGLASADAVIAPSAAFAAALRACYGLRRRIQPIANGRRALDLPPTARAGALTVGRLWDEAKGIATLDAAAGCIAHPVRAAGATGGPNGACLLTRHLALCGRLNEVELAGEYARAAVFVAPCVYEPFGLAVLEAAQAGCALLLSDIATFRELWDGAALFVPAGDPPALAAALARLLDDPAACAALGARARDRARRHTPARMAAETWAVHATILRREAA
jgi:glycogen(starch) synthase